MQFLIALVYLAPALSAGLKVQSAVKFNKSTNHVVNFVNLSRTSAEDSLWDWMRNHGALGTDGVRTGRFLKGGMQVRGLAATRAFKKGEAILRIPAKLVMHAAKSTSNDMDLELLLLTEKRKGLASFWAPYIQSLPSPEDYKSFYPTYMDQSLLKDFKEIPVVPGILDRQQSVVNKCAMAKIADTLDPNHRTKASLEEIRWSEAATSSRQYGSAEFGTMMVPLADLGNTAEPANMEWLRHMVDGYYVYQAATDIKVGEELTESYQVTSHKDNAQFLMNYGFVLPGNPTKVTVCPDPPAWSECQDRRLSQEMSGSRTLPGAFRANLDQLRREYCGFT